MAEESMALLETLRSGALPTFATIQLGHGASEAPSSPSALGR
jgi:hypothetical protein